MDSEEEETDTQSLTRAKIRAKRVVKKVEAAWNDDVTFVLIAAVEKRPVIWDFGSYEYKTSKTDAWLEVAEVLEGKFEWEECKAKWSNLRISFNTNLAKSRKTKSGQGTADNTVQWRFFKAMYFIANNDARQSTASTSNLIIVSLKFILTLNGIIYTFLTQPVQPANEFDNGNDNDNAVDNLSCTSMGSTGTSSTVAVGHRKQRKKVAPAHTASSNEPQQTFGKDAAMHAFSMLSQNDDFTIFGEFIAAELRRLPSMTAQTLKRKLNRTLLDFVDTHEQVNEELFSDFMN